MSQVLHQGGVHVLRGHDDQIGSGSDGSGLDGVGIRDLHEQAAALQGGCKRFGLVRVRADDEDCWFDGAGCHCPFHESSLSRLNPAGTPTVPPIEGDALFQSDGSAIRLAS